MRAIASSPTRLCAKAAADHDAFGVGPGLGLEKAPRHIGQFLREFLDRAVHQRGGVDVVADQHLVERRSCRCPRRICCRADRRRSSSAACASVSRILRNAPLLARSPRKPSSSFSSILKLSTSTDGSRVAPCRPMPVVVKILQPFCPCPLGSRGTTAREPVGFIGRDAAGRKQAGRAKNAPNPSFLAGFRAGLP